MKDSITTKQFHEYLISLNLFRWSIVDNGHGMTAILGSGDAPRIENFTQITTTPFGDWEVRLSKKDYFNDSITNGFFSTNKI